MGQQSKELKELSAECSDFHISTTSLILRTEKMLLTYRKNRGKQITIDKSDPMELRSRPMLYMTAICDIRIPSDTKEFREAVNYLSAAGYMDHMLSQALQEVSLKRSHGDLYYDILVKKNDGTGMTKDYVIASQLDLGHTSMSARKKEAILAVGIEMISVIIPSAFKEIACWGMYEKVQSEKSERCEGRL